MECNTLMITFTGLVVAATSLLMPHAPALAHDLCAKKLNAVPLSHVRIADGFWYPRMETNRRATIPHILHELEITNSIKNFELAAAHATEGFTGPPWPDSDVYKAIQTASYSLATEPDRELEARVDEIVSRIAAAQLPDGYINTYFEVQEPGGRFTDLALKHELYTAGTLFEAGVAHYEATGKRNLLDVAIRMADYIDSIFGPGKQMGYPGHPEIELALIKLWRVTGERRYFDLAWFFTDNRGKGLLKTSLPIDSVYFMDDMPIRDHTEIKGHAVRALYLLSGVADLVAERHDEGLENMLDLVWANAVGRRIYVTGGMGPGGGIEGFTQDYDLPNITAYQETCASVAMAMWSQRMGLLYGDGQYVDAMETALYNAALAGVSLDGKRFFYTNPLESAGNVERSEWFGCCCCPPNIARTVASIGGYAYAASDDALWVNLYIGGSVDVTLGDNRVHVDVATDYPWDGKVKLTVKPAAATRFGLRLRVPGWCADVSLKVNGSTVADPKQERGYVVIDRRWNAGDTVMLDLPMMIQRIEANPRVSADTEQVALRRGPIVYCFESCDQKEPLSSIAIPLDSKFRAVWKKRLLGDVVALVGKGTVAAEQDWSENLYCVAKAPRPVDVVAVPYATWCNRGPGKMAVWMPILPPRSPHGEMEITASFQSSLSTLDAIIDGAPIKNSAERPANVFSWWPSKGGAQWVQYEWRKPVVATGANVYWFDDTGVGECRLPESWQVMYKDGEDWKPVRVSGDYAIKHDDWCRVEFTPVKTTALRLVVELQPNYSGGVHEWTVSTKPALSL